jgi:ribosome maturation factor RimP
MAAAQLDQVRAVTQGAVESVDLVLEDVTVTAAGRRRVVRVVVDLPEDRIGGVPLDAVADASKAVSQALDDSDALGEQPYVLEVSSPGVNRPLTERRHWWRARGRLVHAELNDGSVLEGRITAVGDDGVQIDDRTLTWSQTVRGRVQVEFQAPDEGDTEAELEGGA